MKRAFAILLLAATACTPNTPWRVRPDGTMMEVRPQVAPLPEILDAEKYERASIEDYGIGYTTAQGVAATAHFTVGVIEFTDRGRYWSKDQASSVLGMIEDLAAKPAGVTVVAFAHGWEHGASVCDRDLACFRQVLGQLAIAEGKLFRTVANEGSGVDVDRPIVGLYLGWRGESISKSGWNVLSFYNRKSAAHTIGGAPNVWQRVRRANRSTTTDAADTIARLDAIYRTANTRNYKMSLVALGHSFGGALLYGTVERTLERQLDDYRNGKAATVPGVGDLVVLVNPAFEAQRFRKLDAARRDGSAFPSAQSPVLLTVQSEADGYNLWAFTTGRSLSAWLYPPNNLARFVRSRRAIGYYSPIRTHELRLATGAKPAPVETPPKQPCGCPWAFTGIDVEAFSLTEAEQRLIDADRAGATAILAAVDLTKLRSFGAVTLEPVPGKGCPANYPFPVVKTFGNVIPSHSDIFTPPFVQFLIRYVTLSRAKIASVELLQGDGKGEAQP